MAKLQKLDHGMILRSKNVMDDAMCELAAIKDLVPACIHDRLERLIDQFEDTLCTADISNDIELLTEYLESAKQKGKP